MKQMLQICCKNNNIYKEFPIGSSLLDIYYGFNLNFPYQVVSGCTRFIRYAYVCAVTLLCLVQGCQ